jgi:predicted nucleotidyltransferase component of viral defense system
MSLINNQELLRELITRSADYFKINYLIIEKDIYLFELLRLIAEANLGLVFKGGTSLSMAYRITKRLSEDLDFIPTEPIAKSQRYKLKRRILKMIDSNIFLSKLENDNIGSNLALQAYEFSYNSLFELTFFDNTIKVELYYGYCLNEVEEKQIKSLIHLYLEAINRIDIIANYQINPITLKVLKIEATFIEKIFAICDYYLNKDSFEKSRHLYDIHHLYKLVDKAQLSKLIPMIRNLRVENKYPSAKANININQLLETIIKLDYFKSDYNNITKNLIYDDVTYSQVIATITLIIKQDWF